jgi:DNA modification methylase
MTGFPEPFYQAGGQWLWNAPSMALLPLLPDACADLIVTSPPYYGLRSYTDGGQHVAGQVGAEATPLEYLETLWEHTAQWARVLRPSGSLFVNMGDKYSNRTATRKSSHQDGLFPDRPDLRKDWKASRAAGLARMSRENVIDGDGGYVREKSLMMLPQRYAIGCTDRLGLILRAEIIWSKPSGLPDPARDRVRRSHEVIWHFVKQPRYFTAVDEIREPHADVLVRRYSDWGVLADDGDGGPVWRIASQPLTVPKELGAGHSAAFPMELPRRCILCWSPPGGTVMDPFAGTGTTLLVAEALGRTGAGFEMSADYCRLAAWRMQDPKQRKRAAVPA